MYIKCLVQYAFTCIYFINNNCLRRKSFASLSVFSRTMSLKCLLVFGFSCFSFHNWRRYVHG